MKRLIFSFFLFATSLCGVMAQNDAMYVYRNDGAINAFLKADVDSMKCSQMDLDSLIHSEYVVQEIYTADSIYRIPLAAIDSVGFVTPPTVYKSDVTRLDETLLDYVIGLDSLTLKLKIDTPKSILPTVGDKLVLLDGCEALPYGFSGIVSKVRSVSDGIDVVCEQAYLEDLFDSFCSVSTTYGVAGTDTRYVVSNDRPQRVIYNPDDKNFTLGPFSCDVTGEISQGIIPNGDLALKGGASMSVSIHPTFRIHTFLILGEGHGTYFNCSIMGDIDIDSQTSLYGGIEYSHDFCKPKIEIPVPYTAKLVNFYIQPGFFGRMSATVTSSLSVSRKYTFGMAYDFSSKGESMVKPSLECRLASSSTDFEGCIDGSLSAGGFIETGFNLVSRELAKVCVRGELGWQVNGSFVLRNSDIAEAQKETTLYERLKASSIETGPFVNISLQSSALNTGASVSIGGSTALVKRDIVPAFSNTKLTHTPGSPTSVDAYTEMSGNCVFPVSIGYKLFDEKKNEVADYDASVKYTNKASFLEHSFVGLNRENSYTVYPKVKLFGHDILASPSAEQMNTHPAITGFKVIGSEYSKGGFTNDDRIYDYKFDVALTAEIDNLDGVEDWGYVYEDSFGKIKRISLMQYGTSYTDTRYAYYRNEAKSTACLYAYVRYEGCMEYYDAEPHYYLLEYAVHTCPDNNHPHAIDLGLPSGTKWCCCNVGASAPEEYGGYYAWGETSEKSVYNRDTYAFYSNSTGYVNIGTDISGTQYDVAHVRMGAPWRMPTHEQQVELMGNCTRQWTQQNGVNGILVTGTNGGQVFFPAGGYRWYDNLNYVGSYGYYWSSSLDPGYDGYAYGLSFDSGGWDWYVSYRYYGHSVRSVCP